MLFYKRSKVFFFQCNTLPKVVFDIIKKTLSFWIIFFQIERNQTTFSNAVNNFFCHNYIKPNSNIASSLIISFPHGGSHTISTFELFTDHNPPTFTSTSLGSDSATGQLGEVKVMSMLTLKSSSTFTK